MKKKFRLIASHTHTLLLLIGVFFVVVAAFLVHLALGFLILGLACILLAIYINYEAGGGG